MNLCMRRLRLVEAAVSKRGSDFEYIENIFSKEETLIHNTLLISPQGFIEMLPEKGLFMESMMSLCTSLDTLLKERNHLEFLRLIDQLCVEHDFIFTGDTIAKKKAVSFTMVPNLPRISESIKSHVFKSSGSVYLAVLKLPFESLPFKFRCSMQHLVLQCVQTLRRVYNQFLSIQDVLLFHIDVFDRFETLVKHHFFNYLFDASHNSISSAADRQLQGLQTIFEQYRIMVQ
ncbi:hypothetical protein PCE1_003354 [Barthelona sp. PCE]